MELRTLSLFSAVLAGCIALGLPLLLALLLGYCIFFGYGLFKGHGPLQILGMSFQGVKTVKNILILFLMIGMLTALWRLSGTIPAIVYYSSGFIHPSMMVLMTFLLNCLVSFLTGTSFGTAATMGVITMTMAGTMGISPVVAGGAMLSGIFFGDRCSPVSTSALLVSELTQTDIFRNIALMLKTAAVPFLATCAVYYALGATVVQGAAVDLSIQGLFSQHFRLGWIPLIPALIILVLAALRIKVKLAMLLSILSSIAICVFYQGVPVDAIAHSMLVGFRASSPEIEGILNGGGIASMLRVGAIVCLSSSYAGIFAGTGLLEGLKERLERLNARFLPFECVFGVSVIAAMIACNQTLTIMLTHQVCNTIEPDRQRLAIHLENTAVMIAPLIPWSIAGGAPLATVSAPTVSILAACYLYLVPLWNWFVARRSARRVSA